ncbi:MAG TPA: energy transducer TonB [Quisquiliibacterium sp.]|nr:energy transducer TonB [Quisquiliibacterium sp.]
MPDTRTLRLAVVAISLHALLICAIQLGLERRPADAALPSAMVAELFAPDPAPPAAAREPKPRPAPPTAVRITRPTPAPAQPVKAARPQPAAVAPAPEAATDAVQRQVDDSHAATAAQASAAGAPSVLAQASAPAQGAATDGGAGAAARGTASSGPRAVTLGEIQCATPEPAYPLASRRLGEQGTVRVRLLIDESGAIERAELLSSSGFERLDRIALESARNTRCRPYLVDGRPALVTAVRPFAFRLN